jgi:hypothetical protein
MIFDEWKKRLAEGVLHHGKYKSRPEDVVAESCLNKKLVRTIIACEFPVYSVMYQNSGNWCNEIAKLLMGQSSCTKEDCLGEK